MVRLFRKEPKELRAEELDGVRGEAVVLESVAGPVVFETTHGFAMNDGDHKRWARQVPMVVQVPGRGQSVLFPVCLMTREKYPIAGTTLPIALDAADPNRLEIAWGEVPTVDEWIAAGHEVFTDPDAARARARDAFAAAGGPAQPPPAPAAAEVPSARVLAVSPGTSMSSRSAWNVDMLLSVQLPGEPRYGMRWKGKIDKTRDLLPWSDIPIRAEASKPGKVDIPWDQLPAAPPAVPRHQISLGTYDLRA